MNKKYKNKLEKKKKLIFIINLKIINIIYTVVILDYKSPKYHVYKEHSLKLKSIQNIF